MQTIRAPLFRLALPWLGAILALTLAIGSGILAAELLMHPPASELWELTAYLALAGAGTMAAGWLILEAADRTLGLSLQAKSFLGTAIASGVALLNVLIVAQLMFISTAHDLKLLLALMAFAGIVGVFFSLWVARTVTGRLALITGGVQRLAGGDLSARVPVEGGDEVARLAADVNALAVRLQEAEEQREALDRERRELTIAISHDLRTPLASVRAMVEALDDHMIEGAEVDRYYSTMRREIERLNRMIDDLFELAQIDAGVLKLVREPVSVQEIVADVVDAFQVQATRRDIGLELRTNGRADATLDGSRIERAIANLLRNAIEHTPDGGRIRVSVGSSDAWIEVSVSDNGDGIAEADLPHIWERFYRAEKSRQRSTNGDGAGLGLAIVKGIVEAHDGTVSAKSSAETGTMFTLRLPG